MPRRYSTAHFGNSLRSWRRLNNIKQVALAQMLNVSQPAIARWEQGLDMPSPSHMSKLRDMMATTMRDETALQRLFINRQSAVRALIDFDHMQMLATSEGFRKIWPDFSLMLNVPMRDYLVDEADFITNNTEIRREIDSGEIGLISGVSMRQTNLQLDDAFSHRWHICFRQYGAHTIADMVYEPCEPNIQTGIQEVVRLDSFDR